MQTGWLCPRCGGGNAPGSLMCPCVSVEPKRPQEKKVKSRAKFSPPTINEVAIYCRQRSNKVDPVAWMDYYISNGWKVGRNPMQDWQAAVRTWEKNNLQKESGKKTYEDYQNALKPNEEVKNVNNTYDALD